MYAHLYIYIYINRLPVRMSVVYLMCISLEAGKTTIDGFFRLVPIDINECFTELIAAA